MVVSAGRWFVRMCVFACVCDCWKGCRVAAGDARVLHRHPDACQDDCMVAMDPDPDDLHLLLL